MSDYDEKELAGAFGNMFDSSSEDEKVQEPPKMPEMPTEASQMVNAFREKHANTKFDFSVQAAKDMSTQDLLNHLESETSSASQSPDEEEQLEDLHLSLAALPTSSTPNPDSDWDIIDDRDLLFMDGSTNPTFPTAVYQSPSFRATIDEWVTRYKPSEEKQRTMRAAWTIMKWAGEFGYAVVSEPVFDAAESVVQSQFGTDLEGLPQELRRRAFRSLPEGVQGAINAANSNTEPSVAVAGSIYQRLRDNTSGMLSGRPWRSLLTRSNGTPRVSDEALYAEAQRQAQDKRVEDMMPTIHNDLAIRHGENPDEVEFIDELEGMNIGR